MLTAECQNEKRTAPHIARLVHYFQLTIDLISAETFLSALALAVRCSFPEAECASHWCGRRVGRRVVSAAIWRRGARGERAIVFSILPSRQKVGHELSGINTARISAIISPAIVSVPSQNPLLKSDLETTSYKNKAKRQIVESSAAAHLLGGAGAANICRAACTNSRARI
jgi:hypothetical protein